MRARVLGSAAGGGFPQWNCSCFNCRCVRHGLRPCRPRTQASLAACAAEAAAGAGATAAPWVVVNVSPDVRQQIDACPALQPAGGVRHTPIGAIVLTNADIDHVVGLLSLREFTPLTIYSTPQVRDWVFERNVLFRALRRVPGQLTWRPLRLGGEHPLEDAGGAPLGLCYEAMAVPGQPPGYLGPVAADGSETVGLRLVDRRAPPSATGAPAAVGWLPGLAAVTPEVRAFIRRCQVAFVDGTFFDDDELVRLGHADKSARALGHLPMRGPRGSLAGLADVDGVRKIYAHINNTNPVLLEDGEARRCVIAAGWEVAHDGLELHV